jgi:hypothetical protein
MSETAHRMRYMLCCGKKANRVGCGCCALKPATIFISLMGIIMSIPLMVGIFTLRWRDFDEIPITFAVLKGLGCLAPLLMFIGALKMDFGVSYFGYIFHSLYIYGLILFTIFMGVFFGVIILPVAYISPPFTVFYIGYFLFWTVYIAILMYFNHVYFSFTKLVGLGHHHLCMHLLHEEQQLGHVKDVNVNVNV